MSDQKEIFSISRRNLWKLSGAALGGLSLTSLMPTAFAKAASNTMIVPTQNNPIRIDFNENSLGMSLKAQQAIQDSIGKAFRYADAEVTALKQLLVNHYALSTDYLLLSHGSTEGMRACMEAYGGSDVQFVAPELTYDDGERLARIAQMKITKVAHKENWAFDLEGLQKAVDTYPGRSVVYLVNPNNPTSTVTPSDTIEAWIKSKPKNTMFIVDEAYAEFVDDPSYRSVAGLIQAGLDNVVLLKTFSKIYAMAGMRLGYVLSAPQNIEKISKHVATEDINYLTVCAAYACFDDTSFLATSKASNTQSRKIMTDTLDQLKIQYLPSQTNFIFHQITGSLSEYQKNMRAAHIRIGKYFAPAKNWARISLGTPAEMAYVAKTLIQLRANGAI